MAKIYVSSTFLDLQEFREKILFHLHRLQQSVGAMEYYLADDRLPVAKCVADVKTCDIYVGVYAWRYGTIPEIDNPDKLSITEMEYRAAREKGIPCLIFLHDGKSPWSPDLVDDDKTRIKTFRKKVESEQSAQWFKTSDELASLVGASLYDKLNVLGYGTSEKSVTTFDLEKYYTALRKRYGVLALEGLTPPQKEEYLQIQLRSVFVEQSVRENPPPVELPKDVWDKLEIDGELHPEDLPSDIRLDDVRRARKAYYEKPSRPVLDVLTDSRYQHAIILGDPGSGKSTLARYVMLSLIEGTLTPSSTPTPTLPRFTGEGVLPLLIELRSYAGVYAEGNCTTFLEFLEFLGKTEGWHLTQAALHNHLKNDGRAVVIFDGLDEIFEPELRETITNRIVGFTTDYPKARVIVTSRLIGYRRKILTDAGFTHFTLQDLDEKQVETFVNRWYDLAMSDRPDEAKERRERILKSFKESASIRQLAGNPMLLTIMAIIGKHQELPRERWKLYDHAASVLIQHWDVNKHLKDARIDADFIGEDDKKELLRRLAFRMQGGDGGLAGNHIHREQLQTEFEDYLKARYAQTPDHAVKIARVMIAQFRERNFILSLYGANLFGFVHRAFLEFFCASAFVWKFEKTKELTIEQLTIGIYGKHWEDQSWHEVLLLICGMIDEKWVIKIVDYLTNMVNRPWPDAFEDNPPWNIALAAQSLAEIRNLGLVSKPAGDLLWAICEIHQRAQTRNDEPTLNQFIEDHILPVGSTIGTNWPSRSVLADWFTETSFIHGNITGLSLEGKYYFEAPWGKFIGAVGAGHSELHQILLSYIDKELSLFARAFLCTALATGWHSDSKILDLFNDWAINDSSFWVRGIAISMLAYYCADDQRTVPLLCDRAIKDEDSQVRSAAITALAECFIDAPMTRSTIIDRAINDRYPLYNESEERRTGFPVRYTAITLLGEFWPTDSSTLEFLIERARRDQTPWVRERAKELATKIEAKK